MVHFKVPRSKIFLTVNQNDGIFKLDSYRICYMFITCHYTTFTYKVTVIHKKKKKILTVATFFNFSQRSINLKEVSVNHVCER